jgi:Tol biopolymer transport system component
MRAWTLTGLVAIAAVTTGGCGGRDRSGALTTPRVGRTFLFARAPRAPRVPAQIAFTRATARLTGPTVIAIADLTTGREHDVARLPGARDSSSGFSAPAWSPDGGRLAFTSDQIRANPDGDFDHRHEWVRGTWVVGADGRGLRRLADSLYVAMSPGANVLPQWTPDGKAVITRGAEGVALLPVGTGRRRAVPRRVADIRYASDGRHALLDSGGVIWAVDPHGRRLQRIVADGTQAGWAPGGNRIVFLSARDHHGGVSQGESGISPGSADEIYVADATGRGQRRVTDTTFSESGPLWSPDGRLILFDGTTGSEILSSGSAGLAVVRPDGRCLTPLRTPTSLELVPGSTYAWRPGSDTRAIALRCR